MKNLVKAAAVAVPALFVSAAHAVDITAVTAELTEGQANVETIGIAVLTIAVAIAVFKYVKKAF